MSFRLSQLVLVLLPEAVSSREEVPASLLVQLPHVGLLRAHTQGGEGGEGGRNTANNWEYDEKTSPTCPVCSVSSLLMRYIRKNLKDSEQSAGFH